MRRRRPRPSGAFDVAAPGGEVASRCSLPARCTVTDGFAGRARSMALFPLTFDQPNGAIEFGAMLVTLIGLTFLITRRWTVAVGIPVLGCTWGRAGPAARPDPLHGPLQTLSPGLATSSSSTTRYAPRAQCAPPGLPADPLPAIAARHVHLPALLPGERLPHVV